jgi:ribosomal protein S18 acetylase RimI-like enzyme
MSRLHRLAGLPANFDEYVAEISRELAHLYGKRAAEFYRGIAHHAMKDTIGHDAVDAIAIKDRDAAAGFLVGVERRGVGEISFIHVLWRYAGQGLEQRLLRECVRSFRAGGVDGVVCECVTFCPLDLDEMFRKLGFERVERVLMTAALNVPELRSGTPPISTTAREEHYADIADVIVDAYRDHPGRRLHHDVRDAEGALSFVRQVAAGDYGEVAPGYVRTTECDERCAGTILGCQIMPDHGFVLQVAVRQAYQGRGIGTRLLRELAAEFREAGLSHVVLGVTLSSPAFRLYERLGFRILRPVNAYAWWRP